MKHFLKVAEGLDVMPILAALQRQPELWNQDKLRTSHEDSPHKAADDIHLWFNRPVNSIEDVINDIQTYSTLSWSKLPQIHKYVLDLMRRVDGVQLGRCVITRLSPGEKITPHVDGGAPADFYQRYQIALQSEPGCNFIIEDEQVNFKRGEVWMINNRGTHSVVNNSKADRIVLIVDVRSAL